MQTAYLFVTALSLLALPPSGSTSASQWSSICLTCIKLHHANQLPCHSTSTVSGTPAHTVSLLFKATTHQSAQHAPKSTQHLQILLHFSVPIINSIPNTLYVNSADTHSQNDKELEIHNCHLTQSMRALPC